MDTPRQARPGRPRSEQARRAVLSATLELAGELGPRGLSMDAIARRAGVSKETLYRWWPSKTEVVLEALATRGEETIPIPDTGSLRSDLRVFLRSTVDSAQPTTVLLLRALGAEAATDSGMAQLIRERFIESRRSALGQVLTRAVRRGEITRAQSAMMVDLVYGSLWYRLIFELAPVDRKWADGVANTLTREAATRSREAASR
jgi:AcrR family transcriptional regulator